MNKFNFIQWLSTVGPIAAMFWALRQECRDDRKQMFSLWKENQERWVQCNLRIEQILSRMEKAGK